MKHVSLIEKPQTAPLPGQVVVLTKEGCARVLGGEVGMTFIIDSVSNTAYEGEYNVHVRDYRDHGCARDGRQGEWCIWSLGPRDYKLVNFVPLARYSLKVEASRPYGCSSTIVSEYRGDEAAIAWAERDIADEPWTSAVLKQGDRVVKVFTR